MSLNWGEINGVITLLMMVLFVGIWIWAWRKKHKQAFDRMAMLPMEDDMDSTTNMQDATQESMQQTVQQTTQQTKGKHHD